MENCSLLTVCLIGLARILRMPRPNFIWSDRVRDTEIHVTCFAWIHIDVVRYSCAKTAVHQIIDAVPTAAVIRHEYGLISQFDVHSMADAHGRHADEKEHIFQPQRTGRCHDEQRNSNALKSACFTAAWSPAHKTFVPPHTHTHIYALARTHGLSPFQFYHDYSIDPCGLFK